MSLITVPVHWATLVNVLNESRPVAMSAASLVGALRQLASRSPPVLAPKDFALLGALAQISLVRSKADEARRAGILEAIIAFGAIFPVEAVAGLCTFLQEREHADAFCAQGGASVLLVAFERACQGTSCTVPSRLGAIVPTLVHCASSSAALQTEGAVVRVIAACAGLISIRDSRQPLADVAACAVSNFAASIMSPQRLSALGLPAIALRLLKRSAVPGEATRDSVCDALKSMMLCVAGMSVAALSEMVASGLIEAAMAAWFASPSDMLVVVMASRVIDTTLTHACDFEGMERVRQAALAAGLFRESAALLRCAPTAMLGTPMGLFADCIRNSDATKDAALVTGTAEAILRCLERALSSRPRHAPLVKIPMSDATSQNSHAIAEYECIFSAVQVS